MAKIVNDSPRIIVKLADINREIKALAKLSGEFSARLQIAAASCLVHALEHGNTTPCLDLFTGLSDSINRPALKQWYGNYGVNITFKKGEGFKVGILKDAMAKIKVRYDADKPGTIEAILADKIDAIGKRQAEFNGMNLMQRVASLVKQAKEIAEGKAEGKAKDHEKNNFAGLAELERLVASYKAATATAK